MASQMVGTSGLIMSRHTTFLISSREGSTPTRSQYGGWYAGLIEGVNWIL